MSRLRTRLERIERNVAAPDGTAFDSGIEKVCRGMAAFDTPEGSDERAWSNATHGGWDALTRAEATALKAQGIDSLAGLLSWLDMPEGNAA